MLSSYNYYILSAYILPFFALKMVTNIKDKTVRRMIRAFCPQVESFPSLKETAMSPPTMCRNLPWKIMIMPRNGNDNNSGGRKSMGFFLQVTSLGDLMFNAK